MPYQKSVYKLTTRYEIQKYTVQVNDDGSEIEHSYPNYTNERLTIDDTIDLQDAVTLTRALHILDRIHETVRQAIDDA